MVVDGTQVKVLAWYDNEWGYANRLVELARTVAGPGGRGARGSASSAAEPQRGDLRNYVLVTGAYWADTLTDGAIRMLVLFYFYELGYSPVRRSRSLFLFYEFFGIVTNLVGGWLAARLGLQGDALHGPRRRRSSRSRCSASRRRRWLVVPYVMAAQALSGIAKDLTKMSSKSAVKLVVPEGAHRRALPLGRDPDRLEERAQGRRLLPRRRCC